MISRFSRSEVRRLRSTSLCSVISQAVTAIERPPSGVARARHHESSSGTSISRSSCGRQHRCRGIRVAEAQRVPDCLPDLEADGHRIKDMSIGGVHRRHIRQAPVCT
jgi:hypothetical protein